MNLWNVQVVLWPIDQLAASRNMRATVGVSQECRDFGVSLCAMVLFSVSFVPSAALLSVVDAHIFMRLPPMSSAIHTV